MLLYLLICVLILPVTIPNAKQIFRAPDKEETNTGVVMRLNKTKQILLDFENITGEWEIFNFAQTNVSDQMMNISSLGNFIGVLGNEQNGTISHEMNIEEGSQLEIEFSIFITDTKESKFDVYLETEDGGQAVLFPEDDLPVPDSTWKTYQIAIQMESNETNCKIVFDGRNDNSTLMLDNIKLRWTEFERIKPTYNYQENQVPTSEVSESTSSSSESTSQSSTETKPASETEVVTESVTESNSVHVSTETKPSSETEVVTGSATETNPVHVSTETKPSSETEIVTEAFTESNPVHVSVSGSPEFQNEVHVSVDVVKTNGSVHYHNEFNIQNSQNFSIHIHV